MRESDFCHCMSAVGPVLVTCALQHEFHSPSLIALLLSHSCHLADWSSNYLPLCLIRTRLIGFLLSHVARQTESLVVLTVQPIGVRATFLHDTGLPLKGKELQLKPNPLLVQLVPQVVETVLEALTTT